MGKINGPRQARLLSHYDGFFKTSGTCLFSSRTHSQNPITKGKGPSHLFPKISKGQSSPKTLDEMMVVPHLYNSLGTRMQRIWVQLLSQLEEIQIHISHLPLRCPNHHVSCQALSGKPPVLLSNDILHCRKEFKIHLERKRGVEWARDCSTVVRGLLCQGTVLYSTICSQGCWVVCSFFPPKFWNFWSSLRSYWCEEIASFKNMFCTCILNVVSSAVPTINLSKHLCCQLPPLPPVKDYVELNLSQT